MSSNGRTVDPPFSGAFVLKINGVPIGSFTEITGLAVQLEVEEIAEGGNNESTIKVPGRLKWPNLVFKRGITDSNGLLEWIATCSGDGFAGQGHKVAKRTGSVALLDSRHAEVRVWEFRDVLPVRWTGPQFAVGGNALATEELEVSHGGFGP